MKREFAISGMSIQANICQILGKDSQNFSEREVIKRIYVVREETDKDPNK